MEIHAPAELGESVMNRVVDYMASKEIQASISFLPMLTSLELHRLPFAEELVRLLPAGSGCWQLIQS